MSYPIMVDQQLMIKVSIRDLLKSTYYHSTKIGSTTGKSETSTKWWTKATPALKREDKQVHFWIMRLMGLMWRWRMCPRSTRTVLMTMMTVRRRIGICRCTWKRIAAVRIRWSLSRIRQISRLKYPRTSEKPARTICRSLIIDEFIRSSNRLVRCWTWTLRISFFLRTRRKR